jgi:hypothetical protein
MTASLSARSRTTGRWRTGKVPNYSTDSAQAYAIDHRMKELGRIKLYDHGTFQNYEGAESSTGMGNARAAKQSGVKGFGDGRSREK